MEQVQKSFDKGKKDYTAGDVAKAQADFDEASNLIYASGFRRDADPRLLKLFDEIGEATHSDELNASETTPRLTPKAKNQRKRLWSRRPSMRSRI